MANYEYDTSHASLQLSPEAEYGQQEQYGRVRKTIAILGLGSIAWIGGNAALDNYDGQSGEVVDLTGISAIEYIEPAGEEQVIVAQGEDEAVESKTIATEGSKADDGKLVTIVWNLHGEITGGGGGLEEKRLDEIAAMDQEYSPDASLFQEISLAGAKALIRHNPDYHGRFVVGEAFPRPDKEEFGNLTMTREEPRDVESISLDGSSKIKSLGKAVVGSVQDAWDEAFSRSDNSSWHRLKTSWQENRAAIAVTVPVRIGDEIRNVRITNTHLSNHRKGKVKEGQFEQLDNFTTGTPSGVDVEILAGDFNDPDYVKVTQIYDEFAVPITGSTTRGDPTPIDYFMHKPVEGLTGEVEVLPDMTDHKALLGIIYQEESDDLIALDEVKLP